MVKYHKSLIPPEVGVWCGGIPVPFGENGNVEKSRQRRSRPFAVLMNKAYAPRVKRAAALLDGLF